MRDLFAADTARFNRFSIQFDEILLDFSKNRITEETVRLLLGHAEQTRLTDSIKCLFAGAAINTTASGRHSKSL